MKRALKTILHGTLLFGGAALGIVTGSIPLGIAMIPVMAVSAGKLADDLNGNEVNNSIFSVSKSGVITQNSLAKPYRTLKVLGNKDKSKAFKEESVNMFTSLKQKDKDGNNIIYNTTSHAMTVSMLKQMKKNGYVKELIYEKKRKSNLFLARLFIGNSKGLLKKKEVQMYDIHFTLTNKERKYEDLMKIGEVKPVEEVKEEPNKLNNKNKELEERIRMLKYYREELLTSNLPNNKKRKIR